MKLILFILFCMWIWSYVSFRRKHSVNMIALDVMKARRPEGIDPTYECRLGSAYMEAQQYADAYRCFQSYLSKYGNLPGSTADAVRANIEFCKHPVPGCNGPKNLNGSWWHNFLLVRLGGRRCNMMTQEDGLAINAFLRMKNR